MTMHEDNLNMLGQITARLDKLEKKFNDVEDCNSMLLVDIAANTALTTQIVKDTSEIVSMFRTARSVQGFLGFVLSAVKYLGSIGSAIIVIWAIIVLINHGDSPTISGIMPSTHSKP